jgi:hypothetical protein
MSPLPGGSSFFLYLATMSTSSSGFSVRVSGSGSHFSNSYPSLSGAVGGFGVLPSSNAISSTMSNSPSGFSGSFGALNM